MTEGRFGAVVSINEGLLQTSTLERRAAQLVREGLCLGTTAGGGLCDPDFVSIPTVSRVEIVKEAQQAGVERSRVLKVHKVGRGGHLQAPAVGE